MKRHKAEVFDADENGQHMTGASHCDAGAQSVQGNGCKALLAFSGDALRFSEDTAK